MGTGEPTVGWWRTSPLDVFARSLSGPVIAVDGRGGNGKTLLAGRLARVLDAAVVHSDDVAWKHSRFGWDDLMIDGILTPFLAGREVRYQPPAWRPHGRGGDIVVPYGKPVLILDGVGVSRRSLLPYLNATIWVQSDLDAASSLRDGDEWSAEEIAFLLDDRPWERADHLVSTSSGVPHDPETEVVVGRRLLVRPCVEADVARLELQIPSPGQSRWHEIRYARQVAGQSTFLVATLDDVPVGTGEIRWTGCSAAEVHGEFPDCPELNGLTVWPPELQSQGIGSTLIRAGEAVAAERGCRQLGLGVDDTNPRAAALYLRLGYRETGCRYLDRYHHVDNLGLRHEVAEPCRFLLKDLT